MARLKLLSGCMNSAQFVVAVVVVVVSVVVVVAVVEMARLNSSCRGGE